jgi:hypothetical protein
MNNIKEKPPDFYKGVKLPIKYVLKHPEINLPKINDAVMRAHKIVIHGLMFMKLYLLDYYNKHNTISEIDHSFVVNCLKIVCVKGGSGRPPSDETKVLKETLNSFYEEHYKPLRQDDKLTYTHMNTILDYLADDIIIMYKNNIQLHYVEYIERFVNVCWKKKYIINKIRRLNFTKKEKDNRINKLCSQLRKIKNDILNVENDEYKSHHMYHTWINNVKQYIIPNKIFAKNSIHYDIHSNQFDYLPCMIYMMKHIEREGFNINNVFPLRSDVIPKHITLDSTTIVNLLLRKKQGKKDDYLSKGNLKKKKAEIWDFFFRTQRKCFKREGYSFHHMIETDGVSCSILLIRDDLIDKFSKPKNTSISKELYIDELNDYTPLQNKKIVAIDPGKCDIIYCVDGCCKDATTFRYTQDSRRKETKSKKYNKLILEFKKEKIDGKTIIDYETELSQYNKKSLDINKYKEYIKKKNEINQKLFQFYERYIFRKLKLNGYINRKRNEQKMINKFKKIFGNPDDVVICFGDFEQRNHMKYKEPIKGKGMRTLFRKSGYNTYLVDEYRTSCKCCNCEGGECKTFMVRKSPKPWKDYDALVHGLLRCKSGCGLWNRDVNGAKNIYKIAYNHINGLKRPLYLCRSNQSDTLHDVSNHNLPF